MQVLTLIFFLGSIIFLLVVVIANDSLKRKNMTPEELKEHEGKAWGVKKPEYICPHCQEKGCVYTSQANRKRGISGAKATGAILTGGISILATGLSRKEHLTQAHCVNCDSTWDF